MLSEVIEDVVLEGLGFPNQFSPESGALIPVGFASCPLGSAAQKETLEFYQQWVLREIERRRKETWFDDEDAGRLVGIMMPLDFDAYIGIARCGFRLRHEFDGLKTELERAQSARRRVHIDPSALLSGGLSKMLAAGQKLGQDARQLSVEAADIRERLRQMVHQHGLSGITLIAQFQQGFSADLTGYAQYLRVLYPDYFELISNATPVISIPEIDRTQHTYVTGGSGSGKSETLKALVHGTLNCVPTAGMVIIDPHGDLAEQIARWPEFEDGERLVYVSPTLFEDLTPTINPFEADDLGPREKDVVAQEIVEALEQLLSGEMGGTLSVNMRTVLFPCVLVLLDVPNTSFADLLTFMDDDLNMELVARARQHPRAPVREFFQHSAVGFSSSHYDRTKSAIAAKLQSLRNTLSFDALVSGPSSMNLEQLVNDGKIVVFNLAKGDIGRDASEAVGRFVLAKLQGMALRRQRLPANERRPVHLFIDECQNYISPATIAIMEETRKYGLHLTLAQQVAGRGMSKEMLKVVLNNTNIKLSGRTKEDQVVAKLFGSDLATLQQMQPGEFFLQCGARPAARVQIRGDLVGGNHAMSDEAWQGLVGTMRCYYREVDAVAAPSDGHRERQLV